MELTILGNIVGGTAIFIGVLIVINLLEKLREINEALPPKPEIIIDFGKMFTSRKRTADALEDIAESLRKLREN